MANYAVIVKKKMKKIDVRIRFGPDGLSHGEEGTSITEQLDYFTFNGIKHSILQLPGKKIIISLLVILIILQLS